MSIAASPNVAFGDGLAGLDGGGTVEDAGGDLDGDLGGVYIGAQVCVRGGGEARRCVGAS